MDVEVRLFAVCRERAGVDSLTVELGEQEATVQGLVARLAVVAPSLAPLLPAVRVAVNQAFSAPEDPISAGDEVALIPPVSGGREGLFELRDEPLSVTEVEDAVRHAGAGAVVSFVGAVRDHTGAHDVSALEYEAYSGMAEKYLRKVGGEVSERWPGTRIAMLHRTGHLVPGEASVVISVSSPHRANAFEACRFAIERLKEDVPIWKKEFRGDGSVWVGVGS